MLTIVHRVKCRLASGFPRRKPSPKDYSAMLGAGSVVPCQIEAYFLALNEFVDEGASVLDVGFGLGYGLNILAIKAKEVSGVDVDAKVYNYCCNTIVGRNPRLGSLKVYDGYNLEYDDNRFDVVTCVDVLEHVEDYDRLIREMLRVSKKGLFISTPNRRPEYTNPDGSPKNYWHIREWQFEELDEVLRQQGTLHWHFLNGPWDGPFARTTCVTADTLALCSFVVKRCAE
ncbi:MAG TPA: class I SAM-dependent methyltransferase [Thermoleophilia bacterium]|nr:class I SAM-dependent methyltransferase [Thermoleophilia bacterium]